MYVSVYVYVSVYLFMYMFIKYSVLGYDTLYIVHIYVGRAELCHFCDCSRVLHSHSSYILSYIILYYIILYT